GAAATKSADGAAPSAKLAAGREMIGQLYTILYFLALHLSSSQQQEMTKFDQEIRVRMQPFQASLRRLSALLSERYRSRGSAVLLAIEQIRSQAARVQEYSHANTDLLAREYTTTRTVDLGNRCDAAMVDLYAALTDRLQSERQAADTHSQSGRN